MNPEVVTQFANPDPDAAPLNITQLVALLNTLVNSQIQGSYIPYVIQHGEPGVNDRDKAWIFIDTQGRPIETRIWWANGSAWRRIYNGMIGEVRFYNGDPSIDFDTNGLGNIGGAYDGWHICNGLDGTPDMSDRFPIGAHMNNATVNGYQPANGGWVTTEVDSAGKHQGGVKEITLKNNTTYENLPEVKVGKYTIAGATLDPAGIIWGKISLTDDTKNEIIFPAATNTTPDPINIINPYNAIAMIIFVGYST